MAEHLRALVVILVLASTVFILARQPVTEFAMRDADYVRRRNLWFAVTLLAFLAHSFWLFLGLVAIVLVFAGRHERNPLALYAFLMLAAPSFAEPVGALGVVNQLLELNFQRVLSLVLLVPLCFRLRSGGFVKTDFFVAGFFLVQLYLQAQVDTSTNTLRYGIYRVLDFGLPYYVASRALRDLRAFREVAMAFVLGALVLALVAIIEITWGWLLYTRLDEALAVDWGLGTYLRRGVLLRASATAGHSIVLGYVMLVAALLLAYLRTGFRSPRWWLLMIGLVVAGSVATLSRGPWVGLAIAWVAFLLLGPNAVQGTLRFVLLGFMVVGVAAISPLGDAVVGYLPFVGTIDEFNIDYRQHLFETSVQLIAQYPWFGVPNYYALLEADGLKTGGMVDVVNSYLGIGLANGVIALGFFVGAFLSVLLPLGLLLRPTAPLSTEQRALGASMFALVLGTMVTIFTVSSISFVPYLYWLVVGMAASGVRVLRLAAGAPGRRPVAPRPSVARAAASPLAASATEPV